MDIPQFPEIRLPKWLNSAAEDLIRLAERQISTPGKGASRKAFVIAALKKLLREHDVEGIPDFIEHPAEDMLVEVVVQLVFDRIAQPRARQIKAAPLNAVAQHFATAELVGGVVELGRQVG